MTRNYMAWFSLAVAALFATALGGVVMIKDVKAVTNTEGWSFTEDELVNSDVIDTQEKVAYQITPETEPEPNGSELPSVDEGLVGQAIVDNETDSNKKNTDMESVDEPVDQQEISLEEIEQNAVLEAQQVSIDLEQQYQQLRHTLETEDSYSAQLGEDYYGYGLLLRKAQQYEEAIDAFINALHIEKINSGIYSLKQRAALTALFETHYALGNTEEFEDYLERILWIESKNPEMKDDVSFKMLITVGNQYLDDFLRKPIAGQTSMETLLRAKHHLVAAVKRHGNKPIDEVLMPYGELALISFYEGLMQPDVDKTASLEDPRLRNSLYLERREPSLASYFSDPFPQGEAYLIAYLLKANKEKTYRHAVRALISLGDLSQLFKYKSKAQKYYEQAQEVAHGTNNDDILQSSFSKPVVLPDFQYSVLREPIIPTRRSVLVPLSLTVGKNGKVKDVVKLPPDHEYATYYTTARRAAKRLIFRPKIVDGQTVVADHVEYDIRVYPRK